MKLIKKTLLLLVLFVISCTAFAQSQTFDVVSYRIPKGWQQTKNDGGIQFSVSNKNTGAYAVAVITKARPSTATAGENFSKDWLKLVKGSVKVNTEPMMEQPVKENGWDIISGGANYTDGANTGMVTLLTATGGSQTVSVVLMTNTKQYQKELLSFNNSLVLAKASQNKAGNSTATNSSNNASIVGLWCYNTLESNGPQQYTGGYFRKEYRFYADGTYLYRIKNWAVAVKEIQFVYETGKWKISGNKLSITPTQGKAQLWSKAASGSTKEWGKLVKQGAWKSETVTYTFDLHYSSLMNETELVLVSGTQTEREGKHENNKATYSPRGLDKSLIDNPPGSKTVF